MPWELHAGAYFSDPSLIEGPAGKIVQARGSLGHSAKAGSTAVQYNTAYQSTAHCLAALHLFFRLAVDTATDTVQYFKEAFSNLRH